jgi:hypothetical protein
MEKFPIAFFLRYEKAYRSSRLVEISTTNVLYNVSVLLKYYI